MLRQHDAAADAGKHLSDGIHVGIGFPVCPPEVLLVNQVSVAEDNQTTMLACGLHILERFIESALVNAGDRTDLRSLVHRPPAALRVGRREVEVVAHSSARRQV